MVGLYTVGVFLALMSFTYALPDPEIRLLEDLIETSPELPEVKKRDLEFNQYVPAYRLRGEPSCEELRAMWRLSKREARRATSTNNLPRSRPFSYGRLISFAPSKHQRFVYGEPRNFAHKSISYSPVKGSFNLLRGMMGAGRPGSYQRLRGLVSSQRLPGEVSKGKFDELQDMVLAKSKSISKEEIPNGPSLRSAEMYQPVRRTPSQRFGTQQSSSQSSKEGFVGPLLPGYGPSSALIPASQSDWRLRPWGLQHNSCVDLLGSRCQSNSDCACSGQYRCSKGRCKVLPMHPAIEDVLGLWFSGPVPSSELGSWSKQKESSQ